MLMQLRGLSRDAVLPRPAPAHRAPGVGAGARHLCGGRSDREWDDAPDDLAVAEDAAERAMRAVDLVMRARGSRRLLSLVVPAPVGQRASVVADRAQAELLVEAQQAGTVVVDHLDADR